MRRGERDKLGRRFNIKPKRCAVCEREFEPRNGMQRYCSPTCQRETEVIRGECEWCGRGFAKRKQAQPPRFCGVSCSAKASAALRREVMQGRFPKSPCENCGAPIPSRNKRFCSRACAGVVARQNRKRDWSWQQDWGLSKKGEDECRNCGLPASHLHHIVPRSMTRKGKSDVARNGLPLCFDCHRGWHDRRVTIYRARLRPEELKNAIELAGELWVENNYPYTPDQELRRRTAIAKGDSPENEWRYCLQGREGDRAGYDVALDNVMDTLHAAEQKGVRI